VIDRMMGWIHLRWVKFALVAVLSFGCSWLVAERFWPSSSPIASVETLRGPTASGCHRSYPTLCLPERDRDWNCDDLPDRAFPVLPPDPYLLDADGDGVGCE
jgi:hypothetical protein